MLRQASDGHPVLKPDDTVFISIFYYVGFTQGMEYCLSRLDHEFKTDREWASFWTKFLPPEVSELRFGGGALPAASRIEAMILACKKYENRRSHLSSNSMRQTSRRGKPHDE